LLTFNRCDSHVDTERKEPILTSLLLTILLDSIYCPQFQITSDNVLGAKEAQRIWVLIFCTMLVAVAGILKQNVLLS